MRKALLVVAMVAASFGGGAVVNGPLLAWFRSASGLDGTPIEPLEPESLAAPVIVDETPQPSASTAARAVEPGPEPATTPGPDPAPPPAAAATPEPAPPAAAPGSPRPLDLDGAPPPLSAPPAAGSSEASAPNPPPAPDGTNPREPGWGDAPGSAPAIAFLPGARPVPDASASAPQRDAVVTPAALPSSPGAAAPGPALQAPSGSGSGSASGSAPADGGRWDALRRRMTELGVSRYWVEGEPAGAVRFRCVVPMVGQGAVAQMFEAEADDLPAAAEAALRRLALWRATEPRTP